jgi:hypothetical protein
MYDVELHPNELSGKPAEQADVTTENVIDRLGLGGGRVTDPELINRLNRARAEKKAAEQGADVTGSVTPELQP